ncbi:SPFH domain-containing protein [Clostridium sp.]|uniref:SPFH domain-containing protein n=1 Tax=Clostridium sp. TaxID=1506 RepID=UPI003216EA8F
MAIVGVIKYNGGPDVLAWKYPSEELGTWTQFIVNESQEAILFKGGKALDIFESGRHTLSTTNIPILNNIVNLPFGGRSPFTAEVWYINKIFSLVLKNSKTIKILGIVFLKKCRFKERNSRNIFL